MQKKKKNCFTECEYIYIKMKASNKNNIFVIKEIDFLLWIKFEHFLTFMYNTLRKIDHTIWDSDLQILSRIIWMLIFKTQDFKN